MVRRDCKRQTKRREGRRQRGRFLNRYDFTYAGRDTVNQAFKNVQNVAPGLMKQFSDQVNNVAQQRIQQVLDQCGQKLFAPKIITGAIGKFGKKKCS